jgi:hypothetical protein
LAFVRQLEAEILDHLPADDARARTSRLAGLDRTPRTLVDLGSGDGLFLLGVARRLARRWPSLHVVLADMKDATSDETRDGFKKLGWSCEIVTGDVFDTLRTVDNGAVVTANLFLHHLSDAALRDLLALAADRAAALVACEPRRSRSALVASHLVVLLGANHVTRHDAVASVRAGFQGRELSALWPQGLGWSLREGLDFPFTHGFSAVRDAG